VKIQTQLSRLKSSWMLTICKHYGPKQESKTTVNLEHNLLNPNNLPLQKYNFFYARQHKVVGSELW
jgi:hypothetical protein